MFWHLMVADVVNEGTACSDDRRGLVFDQRKLDATSYGTDATQR